MHVYMFKSMCVSVIQAKRLQKMREHSLFRNQLINRTICNVVRVGNVLLFVIIIMSYLLQMTHAHMISVKFS